MGLLDEAIREHIELKRRAGASAEDVARMEREALSPARREAAVAAEAEAAPAPALEDPEHEDELPPADPPIEAPVAREPVEEAPVVAVEPEEPAAEDAEPEAPTESPASAAPATAEWDLEEAFPQEGASEEGAPEAEPEDDDGEGEDVLEETPDFLQETPEHDRLWFEQKPPRDFDFDH